MNNINHKLTQTAIFPSQVAGSVTHCFANGTLTVESDGRGWHCRRAASCLLAPQLADTVLITTVDNQIWVLAVLERANAQSAMLTVDGDLHIHSEGELSFTSEALRINAEQGDCHINEMKYSGKQISAWLSVSRIVGKHAETVWQSVSQISQNLFRYTQKTEQIHVGQLDIQAEDYARIHAQNTVITSTAITKIDSEQIHMG